jgi:hypothetical protein
LGLGCGLETVRAFPFLFFFLSDAFKMTLENQRENDVMDLTVLVAFAFLVCSYYKPHQVAKVRSL